MDRLKTIKVLNESQSYKLIDKIGLFRTHLFATPSFVLLAKQSSCCLIAKEIVDFFQTRIAIIILIKQHCIKIGSQ